MSGPINGSVFGDIAGSGYEFMGNNEFVTEKVDLLNIMTTQPETQSEYVAPYKFTDDSILTMAMGKAIRESRGKSEEEFMLNLTRAFLFYGKKYSGKFPGGFGNQFGKWLRETEEIKSVEDIPFSNSWGNGALMRVGPIGYAFNSLAEVEKYADLSARVTHDHVDSRRGAQAVAAAIYLSRAGMSKADIKLYLETRFGLDLSRSVAEWRDYNQNQLKQGDYNQSEGALTTAQMALAIFLEGNSYEECSLNAISIGGDSDTLGAIVGSMAYAKYGMPDWMSQYAESNMDDIFLRETKAFEDDIKANVTEPPMGEIEIAMAKARLEKHILDAYKKDNSYVPADDPEYLKLLAEMEAVRLFHEELSKEQDPAAREAMSDHKQELLAQLTEQLRESPELKAEQALMTECPVQIEDVDDCDASKLVTGGKSPHPETRAVMIHEMIPDRIVENSAYRELLTEGIKNAKAEVEKKNAVREKVKKLTDKQPIKPQKAEKYYSGIMDGMVGSLQKDKALAGLSGRMSDILQDLQNMKDTEKYDPKHVSKGCLKKLKQLSGEMLREAALEDSEEMLPKIAFVNRLTDALEGFQQAPKGKRAGIPKRVSNKHKETVKRKKQIIAERKARQKKYEADEKARKEEMAKKEPKSLVGMNTRSAALGDPLDEQVSGLFDAFAMQSNVAKESKNSEKVRLDACANMKTAAQKFIDAKAPNGDVKSLDDMDKQRVEFAKDMIEYAGNAEASINRQKEREQRKANRIPERNARIAQMNEKRSEKMKELKSQNPETAEQKPVEENIEKPKTVEEKVEQPMAAEEKVEQPKTAEEKVEQPKTVEQKVEQPKAAAPKPAEQKPAEADRSDKYYLESKADFENGIRELEAASAGSLIDSRQYKEIINTLKLFNHAEQLPVNNKVFGKYRQMDPMKTQAFKLAFIKDAIDAYMDHKAKDGVKRNSCDKLDALGRLNRQVCTRLKNLTANSASSKIELMEGLRPINTDDPKYSACDDAPQVYDPNGDNRDMQARISEAQKRFGHGSVLRSPLDVQNVADSMYMITSIADQKYPANSKALKKAAKDFMDFPGSFAVPKTAEVQRSVSKGGPTA